MRSEDHLYWIWLAEKCGPASKEFSKLADQFGSPFELYRMEAEELESLRSISRRLRTELCDKSLEHAYSILRYCKKNGIGILHYGAKEYPSCLRSLEDPPAVLYYMGTLPDFDRTLCVGVVGTRKVSEYGVASAYTISYELAAAGVAVISGMALGVDGIAACAALEAGGVTVAVLGCGLDVTYPKAHEKLRRAILKNGALISEFAPGEKPYGFHFPLRNRIISGLSQGVLVVEGSNQSGAMITAERAIAQGREVFALPGKIDESNSEGPNSLIRNGANVALKADDIILHYDFLYHDMIHYTALQKAKRASGVSLRALERYGVDYVPMGQPKEAPAKRTTAKKQERPAASEADVAPPREEAGVEPIVQTQTAESALAGLDETSRRVFSLLPLDRAVAADAFLPSGIGIAEAVTALTMLEIEGLVVSLPGGLYTRK